VTEREENVVRLSTDVLVLGGGPAGAWAALSAAESGASVVLADKGRMGTSGATAAANTAVIDVAPRSESREKVLRRRIDRGFGLVEPDRVLSMVDEVHGQLTRLTDWGYKFPLDDRGRVYRGSLRGPDYMQILRRRLQKLGVKLLDHSPALELIVGEGEALGARGVVRSGDSWEARAKSVVVATGGCAFMSKALGTYGLTGDGLLLAAEAGAVLSGMEFSGQYGVSHVSASVTKNLIYDWATFSNEAGRTLEGDDIFELLARHLPHGPVYAIIDKASPAVQEGLRRGQPNILLPLDRQGIDPFRQRFPVTLCYEGTVRGVGGLAVDANGATSVPGLFAAGDVASREAIVGAVTGGGGPNSTWAIASGAWAGRSAASRAAALGVRAHERRPDSKTRTPATQASGSRLSWDHIAECISLTQSEMLPLERSFYRDGIVTHASAKKLDAAWLGLRSSRPSTRDGRLIRRGREAAAMLATARWICASAVERRETRGIHRRRDYPTVDPARAFRLEVSGLDNILVRPAR
jgi:succinate dehydrogenase/fumarate reductase flavoprotein subunit